VLIVAMALSMLALAAEVTDAMDPFAEEAESSTYTDLNEKFSDILDLYKTYHLNQVTDEELLKNLMASIIKTRPDLFDQLVNGMVNQTDRFNNFFTKEEYQLAFYPPDYVGIGVKVTQAGDYVSIIEVFANSPAKEVGLKVGDVIVKVDGIDVAGLGIERTGTLIRGEEGTQVTVSVQREGQILDMKIERKPIRVDSIENKMIGDIAYISVRDFENFTVFLKFYTLLRDLSYNGAKGYIIDLRNNTGGDVDTALNMANCFMNEDDVKLATFYEYDGSSYTVSSVKTGLNLSNVAVLVNEGSYSSAEVMAGILKDVGAAVVVGTQTGGKGIGQNHLKLKDGSVLTVTTSEVELPQSGKYHGIGIFPDIIVENGYKQVAVPDLFPMTYDNTWKIGQIDANILGMEQRLMVLGYSVGTCDPIYDQKTADAVWTFQKDKGLSTLTGTADPQTLKAIDKAIIEYMNQTVYQDTQFERALVLVTRNVK
jgi:carboxyl-terminal processing protease